MSHSAEFFRVAMSIRPKTLDIMAGFRSFEQRQWIPVRFAGGGWSKWGETVRVVYPGFMMMSSLFCPAHWYERIGDKPGPRKPLPYDRITDSSFSLSTPSQGNKGAEQTKGE